MLKDFIRYFSVGLLNTVIHWGIFALVFYCCYPSQAVSNVIGFAVAVTVSFFLNARYTFDVNPNIIKYLLFIVFMGGLNFVLGWAAQRIAILPIVTMILSSGMSLILGFLYSRFIVFTKPNLSLDQ